MNEKLDEVIKILITTIAVAIVLFSIIVMGFIAISLFVAGIMGFIGL
jgi:hypothetical protein